MRGESEFLGKDALLKLKLRAMRKGVWFRSLPRIDRVLVEVTVRVTENVRSLTLMKGLWDVARKIEVLLESRLSRAMREVGFSRARKLAGFARSWGNSAAEGWSGDKGFARYLAAMNLNAHGTFGA